MRGVVALGVLWLGGLGSAGLATGCQSGTPAPPPAPAAAPAGTTARAADPVTATGSAAADAAPAHVRLPRSGDAPVHRTTRPLDRRELDRLAAVEFPDFDREDRAAAADAVEFRHTTQTRPKLGVTVAIAPCTQAHACPAMALARWTARRDELERQLPGALRHRPDTRFQIGARVVAGAPAIYTYQLGYAAGIDEHGQPTADYSDAYAVYYNDGKNQIRVMAHYLDDSVGGIDQLLAVAPPDDLETLAIAFASFYVRAWD